jgi:hypothetical protein
MRCRPVRQGEIRRRLDTTSPVPFYVMVLSGANHLAANTGQVVVCRVIPGPTSERFPAVHSVSYTNADGLSTIGLAVPELLEWYPRSALSEPVGHLKNVRPVLSLVRALFE